MSERRFIAGLDRFDKKRDNGHGTSYPTLPLNIGKVHAIHDSRWMPSGLHTEPQFCDSPFEYKMALCGATVKVVLPLVFDPGDPDVCPGCSTSSFKDHRPRVQVPE